MKAAIIILFLFVLTNVVGQNNNADKLDSSLWIRLSLHHQVPSFQYFNEEIENGIFEKQIVHKGEIFNVQGGFKEYKADGLWVAFDSSSVPRLLALFQSDTLVFLHLNDSLGRPAHHFTFNGLRKLNEEWYYNGRLNQYNEYSSSGCKITTYHENLKHRITLFIDEQGIAFKKIIYDANGVFVKETYDVNE